VVTTMDVWGWFGLRSTRRLPDGAGPFANLSVEELIRLARWASAYGAEAVHGAEDGKKWAFARYLLHTRRLNEEC